MNFLKIFLFLFLFNCKSEPEILNSSYLKVSKITSYTGKNLTDSIFTVHGRKNKNILNITNEYEKFHITLPYEEDWVFNENLNSVLDIKSNNLNLNISVSKEQDTEIKNPENFLKELKNRIESRIPTPILKSEIINSPTNPILKFKILNPENGYKNFHYWSIRQNRSFTIYKLHSSFEIGQDEVSQKLEDNMKFIQDSGFQLF